jgi:hypothetical protein
LLRRPRIASEESSEEEEEEEEENSEGDEFVDWEDKILEVTVPLVGFVRMILHSGKYANRDRLSPEHERTIIEMLLPYHPECEKKIGCGIDYIMVCIMLSRFGNNISLCGHYGHPFTNQA